MKYNHDQLSLKRPQDSLKSVSAMSVLTMFEDAYAKAIAWRKSAGMSPEEVAGVIRTRVRS